MPQTPARTPTPASLGCLAVIASPFLVFGLIMLAATYGQLSGGAGLGALKYGIGALVGLTIGVGIIRGRNVDPSKVSKYPPFAFYYAIGGCFLIGGLLVLRTALAHRGGPGDDALAYGVIAGFLLLTGGWFIVGGGIQTRRDAPLAAALQRNDPEPWRYVRRWADGKVRDSGMSLVSRQLIAALVVNLVTWPIALGWTTSPERAFGVYGLAVWLLPLAGVVMLVRAALDVRRRIRYGGMTFAMTTFPGVVGGKVAGTVWARTDLEHVSGATLTATLTCLRRRETMSSRRDNRVQLTRIAQQRQTVPAQIYRHDGARYVGIPVSFDIPLSAAPTTLHDPNDRVLWQLEIESDARALPVKAAMEVPIFDLRDETERAQEVPDLASLPPDAPAAVTVERAWAEHAAERPAAAARAADAAADRAPVAAARSMDDSGLRQRLLPSTASRIVIDEDHTGRITVSSESGEPGRARIGLVLLALCVLGFLAILRSPALQGINGIGLLPIWGAIAGGWLWFSYRHRKAEVTLSRFDVTVRSWALADGVVMLPYDELERASVETGVERTTPPPSGTVIKAINGSDVQFTGKDGRRHLAGLRATDRQQAQWVAGHVNRRIAGAAPESAEPPDAG